MSFLAAACHGSRWRSRVFCHRTRLELWTTKSSRALFGMDGREPALSLSKGRLSAHGSSCPLRLSSAHHAPLLLAAVTSPRHAAGASPHLLPQTNAHSHSGGGVRSPILSEDF